VRCEVCSPALQCVLEAGHEGGHRYTEDDDADTAIIARASNEDRCSETSMVDSGLTDGRLNLEVGDGISVLVIEQMHPEWDARRWRYTAATRAKERLVWAW
jgi:hypothetical protein